MSETKPPPESQHQRWLKYGLNVGITVLVVLLLAGAVIYLSQKYKRRFDRTSAGNNSLKTQTRNILSDLKKSVTIVSLYSKNDSAAVAADPQWGDRVSQVDDLLDEYKRSSNKIDIQVIDPITERSKVDDLIESVINKYGGEVKKYKEFLDRYPAQYEKLNAFAKAEAEKVSALPFDQIEKNASSQSLGETLTITILTVQGFPNSLDRGKQRIDRQLKQKPPDYKGATETVEESMSSVSLMLDRIIADLKEAAGKPGIPAGIQAYFQESLPRYEEAKKISDGLTDEIKKLGELKLDSLRTSLKEKNSILVMGDNDLKVLPQNKVWQRDVDRKVAAGQDPIKPRFAGEQQITTAILSLTAEKKPKVCFMRPGGPPLADSGMFGREGPFSEVADRLRDYNFTVMEKDFTGMWAMQSQMQQRPAPPEPTDEEVKDAIWIVINARAPQSPMGMPAPSIAAKLTEHLANGGSALVMTSPGSDALTAALSPWGVETKTDQVIVKEPIKSEGGREGDQVERAEREQQPVFILREYGDHMLAKPIRSLDGLALPLVPVVLSKKDGFESDTLMPGPKQPASFGVSIEAMQAGSDVKFDKARGDTEAPVYGGAAVQKKDGGRLVVLGSYTFAMNDWLSFPDEALRKQGYNVPRFPGNPELFANSVYWLAKLEPMIAISPSNMQIERIAPMTETANRVWNVGVLLLLLPGLAVIGGLMMYFARRD